MSKILIIIKSLLPTRLFKALQPAYHYVMAGLAALAYRFPSEKIIVIGVTGTTGKTTSVYLIAKTLEESGYKVGFTSTAMFNNGEKEWLNDKKMTMVGRFFTQKMIREMIRNGCRYAIIETTSEGIRQFRHKFINYDIVVFTGLYPEHIESHGSFENYKLAKGRLFEHLSRGKTKYVDQNKCVNCTASGLKKTELRRIKKTIIANLDDDNAEYFLDHIAEQKIGFLDGGRQDRRKIDQIEEYWKEKNVEIIKYGDIAVHSSGVSFNFDGTAINTQLLGEFNVINAMTAVATAINQEISIQDIKKGLESIKGVAGRIERIEEGQPFMVIVDYAFEPNALNKLYETIGKLPHQNIIHVLGGTGGGRDAARRPLIGKIAGEKADIVIVTNEDPYDEDPAIIIDQVAIGAEHAGKINKKNMFRVLDREEAIHKALKIANDGDIVLITGKGSEQAIMGPKGEMIPWDDRAVARGWLGNQYKKNKR